MEIFRGGEMGLSDDSTCHQLSVRICVEGETQTHQRVKENGRKVSDEISPDSCISHNVRSARRTCLMGNIVL